jgi:hypothetical protein
LGASEVFLLAAGASLFLLGLCWTAYVAGRATRDAVLRGAIASVAAGGVLLLAWAPLGAVGFAPAFVLATVVAAMLLVPKPTSSARYFRAAAVVVLVLASLVDDSLALVLLALLAFPAVGLADTIASGVEGDRER